MTKDENVIHIRKKYLIFGVIVILIIVFYLGVKQYANSGKLEILEEYDDKLIKCSLDLETSFNTQEYEAAKLHISTCKSIVNDALFYVEKMNQENPSDRDILAAKLDYESSGYMLDSTKLLVDLNGNTYSEEQIINKVRLIVDLLDKCLSNVDKLEREYSDTDYYYKFFTSKGDEWVEDKAEIIEIRDKFKKELEPYDLQENNLDFETSLRKGCPEGYIREIDSQQCVQICESGSFYVRQTDQAIVNYCKYGSTCFNGKCASCPSGTYLATDGRCYSD